MAYIKLPKYSEPNWNDAPSWAQWWAMDKNGAPFWYETRPTLSDEVWWDDIETRRTRAIRYDQHHFNIRGMSIDWTATLRQRTKSGG